MRPETQRERRTHDPFIMLYRDLLIKDQAWRKLSAGAKILYLYLKAKYNGHNNGRIRFTYREAAGIAGISSPKAFSAAKEKLVKDDWITVKGSGGRNRRANLYTLTGKYDRAVKNEPKNEDEALSSNNILEERLKVKTPIEKDETGQPNEELSDEKQEKADFLSDFLRTV